MRQLAVLMMTLVMGVAIAGTATEADAQIGRIRNNVGRAVERASGTRSDTAQQSREQQGTRAANQITTGLLDRFEVALASEITDIDAHARRQQGLAAEQEKYGQCMITFVQSAEYTKLMERMQEASDKNDMKAAQQVSQDQVAAMEKACGPNPNSGSSYQSARDRERKAAQQAQLTEYQYAILKERVPPLCRLDPADDADNLRVQGAGVFSNEEIRAIKPRCAKLMSQVQRIS